MTLAAELATREERRREERREHRRPSNWTRKDLHAHILVGHKRKVGTSYATFGELVMVHVMLHEAEE